MSHRLEKLSTLFDSNESQLNVSKRNEHKIKHKNELNETNDDNSY